jgi:subtilisin family serine protease
VLPLSKSYTSGTAGNVTAYVLDTGVKINHADFGGRASYGRDFIDNDAVADDCNGHGTHVAGTIGGASYGVAKQVKLVAVRVLNCSGSGSYSQILAGVDWVTKNAVRPAVANMSLGGSTTSSKALEDGVRRSIAAGVSYAIAAGNDNKDACAQTPARVAAAITVGAIDSADSRATFSNFGTCVDLFAPGVKIVSTSYKGGTATMSGTSMAAPHVAGVVALVLAATPTATPAQVSDVLVRGATPGRIKNAGGGSPNLLLYSGVAAVVAPATPATPLARRPTSTKVPMGSKSRTTAGSQVPSGSTR